MWMVAHRGTVKPAVDGLTPRRIPGGAIMASLGLLASILGFDPGMQAMMIALYIAMDSFGTACNVTGDGAIAVIVDKIMSGKS